MELVTVLLIVGATARITRLLTIDELLRKPRNYIVDRFGEDHLVSYQVRCPWCIAPWVLVPAMALARGTGAAFEQYTWWQLIAAWLSLSFVASALVVMTDR